MANKAFGSYYDADSPLHRLHPAVKAVSILILTITVGTVKEPSGLFFFWFVFFLILITSKLKPKIFITAVVPLLPIVVFSFVAHFFFGTKDAEYASFIVLRLTLIIFFSSLLTVLIKLDDLTALFYRFFSAIPFADAKGMSVSLSCALSFVPMFFSYLAAGEKRLTRIFSVNDFLAPLAANALNHSRCEVQQIFDDFDDRMRLPKAKVSDYAVLTLTVLLCFIGYYV